MTKCYFWNRKDPPTPKQSEGFCTAGLWDNLSRRRLHRIYAFSLIVIFPIHWNAAVAFNIDCDRASYRDEFAVCGSPQLRELDSRFAQLALRVEASGNARLQDLIKSTISARRTCGQDERCLVRAYNAGLKNLEVAEKSSPPGYNKSLNNTSLAKASSFSVDDNPDGAVVEDGGDILNADNASAGEAAYSPSATEKDLKSASGTYPPQRAYALEGQTQHEILDLEYLESNGAHGSLVDSAKSDSESLQSGANIPLGVVLSVICAAFGYFFIKGYVKDFTVTFAHDLALIYAPFAVVYFIEPASALIAFFGVWWHMRRRCPHCYAHCSRASYIKSKLQRKETEWRDSVTTRTDRFGSMTGQSIRRVPVTVRVYEDTYECDRCGGKWSRESRS